MVDLPKPRKQRSTARFSQCSSQWQARMWMSGTSQRLNPPTQEGQNDDLRRLATMHPLVESALLGLVQNPIHGCVCSALGVFDLGIEVGILDGVFRLTGCWCVVFLDQVERVAKRAAPVATAFFLHQ